MHSPSHDGDEKSRLQGGRPGDNRLQQHGHAHGAMDRVVLTSSRGIWATKVSLAALLATAAMQVVIVVFTGSVALLADTVHNFSDAATALPLWAAFTLARRRPTRRFTYGYGRAEDLAGLLIVVAILGTGIFAGYQSISRLSDPPDIDYIWAVVIASVVGFIGNEAVALFRIKVGKEIGSAALVADGLHARVDGLTSLAVLVGAVGVWLGAPLADPIAGVVITVAIFRIVVESGKSVVARLLDGVEPGIIDEVRSVLYATGGVEEVTEVRVRWSGHSLLAEVNLAVRPSSRWRKAPNSPGRASSAYAPPSIPVQRHGARRSPWVVGRGTPPASRRPQWGRRFKQPYPLGCPPLIRSSSISRCHRGTTKYQIR